MKIPNFSEFGGKDENRNPKKIDETIQPDRPYKTYDEVRIWLDFMEIENYTIGDDLVVDVDGSVDISHKQLKIIPVQFGEVRGVFACAANFLKFLGGCPTSVKSHFECWGNNIKSLVGGPTIVGGDYNCEGCPNMVSIDGISNVIGGDFVCTDNNMSHLNLNVRNVKIDGDFDISDTNVRNLESCPNWIGGDLICFNTPITTYKQIDFAIVVKGDIICDISTLNLLKLSGIIKSTS